MPGDLSRQTLVHSAPRPLDWQRWLEAAGVDGVDGTRGLRFESLNLAIQAAIEGIGVAIGVEALIREDLERGRLVRPLDVSRQSRRPFHVVYRENRATDPKLTAFRDWLLEEAASSAAATRSRATASARPRRRRASSER